MACLNMQVKNEKQGGFMGPRISFSNDFIDSNHHEISSSYREAPVSSDFEFSVPSFSSNSADEVCFFKGKLPPVKENNKQVMTLRDELLAGEEDNHGMVLNNNNNKNNSSSSSTTGWWKEKFGLRKSHNAKSSSSSDHKNLGGLETIDEAKINPTFHNLNFTGSNRYK